MLYEVITNLKLKEKSLDLLNNCDILFADAFSEDLEQVRITSYNVCYTKLLR